MISYYPKPFSRKEALESLHPTLRKWFEKKYKDPTPPQSYSFKLISQGHNVLITAPTGSGKTFSGFMAIISDLLTMAEKRKLEDKIYCIYISPLRALNNDVYRNLNVPLEEIYAKLPEEMKKISIGIRTGDTTTKERQKQLRKPPNILITTPESLAILLNSPRFVLNLQNTKYIVIDELHELANNKRGVHLSLSLERLSAFAGHDFIRVGLGATLSPLDEAARFLVGYKNNSEERDCYMVDATWDKKMQYTAMSPVADMINTKSEKIETEIYKLLNKIIKKNKTTLIFTNTRSGTERTVYNLMKKFKYNEETIAAHHGSLSRETRLGVEDMLKKGKLKCAVSSTSLELGVDIGDIDNVVQLGSPKSITRAIQRIGRSGHSFKDVATGEIVVLNRDDLVECAVMLDAAKNKRLDSFNIPKNALDVLAQHVVGMSLTKKWKISEAFSVIKHAYPYHSLQKNDFQALLDYLAGNYVGLESRRVYGKIWLDDKEKTFGRRGRFTRLIYYLNLGTIPDEVGIEVYEAGTNKWIGSIEEEFLSRLKPGDIFVLGGRMYRFERSKGMRCYVLRADGSVPTIPPWFSEQLPLTYELALEIGKFRGAMHKALKGLKATRGMISKLKKNTVKMQGKVADILNAMPLDEKAKESILGYFTEQVLYAKDVPNDKHILIEKTFDSKERNVVVFHSLYGRKVNDALSRAFAIKVGEELGIDVGLIINDNGFAVVTEKRQDISSKQIKHCLMELTHEDISLLLKSNIRRTEMMKRRFRHCAARSFMVLRNYKGKKISVNRQQINSQLLLTAVEEISSEFPILKETYREILEDVMDMPRAKQILSQIASGKTNFKIIRTKVPSPFSHVMLTFGEADIVMMKDRRKRMQELHKQVMKKISAMV